MPGVWVFAGGAVDPEDRETGFAPAGIDPDEAAHRVCAARELGEEASLAVEPSALRPWSRWVTPEVLPIRFDTRFYVGPAPEDVDEPSPDMREIDAARWIAPALALEQFAAGDFELPFPTMMHVQELSAFAGRDAVLAAATSRTIEPVMPKLPDAQQLADLPFPDGPSFSD